ncbi:hypothetical protein GQ53DRAFT_837449 [Thozetella sp. PMI_491]|nr:hypothetical protein GQ53DRAFT_837449 [Thozetella sp. PMI_491]
MTRPRFPSVIAFLQISFRTTALILEVSMLGYLSYLAARGVLFLFALSGLALAIVVEFTELFPLLDSHHNVPRLASAYILLGEIVAFPLLALGTFSVLYLSGSVIEDAENSKQLFIDMQAIWLLVSDT